MPERVIHAGSPAALAPLYPGAATLRTISECVLLQVPDTVFEMLQPPNESGIRISSLGVDSWEGRFLGSELMAGLSPPIWQQVLRQFRFIDESLSTPTVGAPRLDCLCP